MAENMLAFVASVSLALVQERDREESGVNLRELWQGGVSAGGWKEAIRLCSQVFTGYKNYPLAATIKDLKVSSERNESFGGDVKELIRQRNNLHHGSGPATPEEFQNASEDIGTRLQRCMQRLNFFTEYPIRQVQDFDVSRYSAEARLTCLRYMGDHPGLEAVMNSNRNGLVMRKTWTARTVSRTWNPHFYGILTQVHNTL